MIADFFSTYQGQLVTNFALTGIVVVGFYVTFLSGQLSVAHQMFMSAGAYAAGYLSVEHGWRLWQTMPASILVAAAIGVITALVTVRLNGMFLAIATLALSESAVVLLNNTDAVGGIYGLPGIELSATGPIILVALGVSILMAIAVDRSSLGLWLRSAADDELAAESGGVRVRLTRVVAFGLGAAIAGIGGNLYAHRYGYVEPSTFGLALGLQLLLATRLGGRGFVAGPVIGAAVVIWLPEPLRELDLDRDIVFGALLIAIVILRPNGIVGDRVALMRVGRKAGELVRRRGRPPAPAATRESAPLVADRPEAVKS